MQEDRSAGTRVRVGTCVRVYGNNSMIDSRRLKWHVHTRERIHVCACTQLRRRRTWQCCPFNSDRKRRLSQSICFMCLPFEKRLADTDLKTARMLVEVIVVRVRHCHREHLHPKITELGYYHCARTEKEDGTITSKIEQLNQPASPTLPQGPRKGPCNEAGQK